LVLWSLEEAGEIGEGSERTGEGRRKGAEMTEVRAEQRAEEIPDERAEVTAKEQATR
jgi:hypothetical protein